MRTTACVVGGGPAGMMLGLLLARQGVEVVVMEKHADFLRDFRGDTVHPSTIQLLDELGIVDEFLALPHHKAYTLGFDRNGRRLDVVDFRLLNVRYPYVAFVPQWDFLNLLAAEAERYPNFRLLRSTPATGLLWNGDTVVGVEHANGVIEAALTIAADGRHSAMRQAAGLRPHAFGSPMDVLQVKVSKRVEDPEEGFSLRLGDGLFLGVINRSTYWIVAYVFAKGAYEAMRADGGEAMRRGIAREVPFLADRVDEITLDQAGHLEVRIDRLRRWHRPGLLLIGDAAHAMSPIGGVGINLAVQDAVATANLLARPLRSGRPVKISTLAKVRRRRYVATAVTQGLQRVIQRVGIQRALSGGSQQVSTIYEQIGRFRPLRKLMSRVIGVGVRPEHVGSMSESG
jgi:2-polyprenyl-6-methoxyphenol hydroxylase-like FAD-dependent oxidoreductase